MEVLLQQRGKALQPRLFEVPEISLHVDWRAAKPLLDEANRLAYANRVQLDQVTQKVIRRDSCHTMWIKRRCRKVPNILGDDNVAPTLYCRGKHMIVLLIRQIQTLGQRFLACHKTVSHSPVNQLTGPLDAIP